MTLVTTPYDYAGALLAVCEEAIAATAAGAIDRAYVSPGLPSIDCATLAVTVVTLGEANTGSGSLLAPGHRHRLSAINLLGFAVTIARDCVPVSDGRTARPPTVADLEEAAGIVLADVWSVWNAITEAMDCGELFGGRCTELFMEGAAALATSGMTAGYVLSCSTSIGGIPRDECEPEPPVSEPFEVAFSELPDGPLPDTFEDVGALLTYDPGLAEPQVVDGVLVGANPEAAPMAVAEGFYDTVGFTFETQDEPGLGSHALLLFPDSDATRAQIVTIFASTDGYDWQVGPTYTSLLSGTFSQPVSAGDRFAMRVEDGVSTLYADQGGGWEVVASAADPVGLGDLRPVLYMSGALSSISDFFATNGDLPLGPQIVEYPFTVDGPLAAPWIVDPSPEVVYSYDGYVPVAAAGVVAADTGEGVNTAVVQRPDLAPASLVGLVVDDWSTDPGNNVVSLFLAYSAAEWFEFYVTTSLDGLLDPHTYIAVDHYWDDGNESEVVIASVEVTPILAGAAVALRVVGNSLTVQTAADGDPDSLEVVEAGAVPTPVASGSLTPAFLLAGAVSVSGFFTRA